MCCYHPVFFSSVKKKCSFCFLTNSRCSSFFACLLCAQSLSSVCSERAFVCVFVSGCLLHSLTTTNEPWLFLLLDVLSFLLPLLFYGCFLLRPRLLLHLCIPKSSDSSSPLLQSIPNFLLFYFSCPIDFSLAIGQSSSPLIYTSISNTFLVSDQQPPINQLISRLPRVFIFGLSRCNRF